MSTPKYKHLSFEDRCVIQEFLNYGYNFTQISNRLNKNRTTISKEVYKNKFIRKKSTSKDLYCPNTLKPPYVCNACPNINYCSKVHFSYDASIVEMDTVIGTSGGKGGNCFLTLLFRKSKLMLIYLLPYKKSEFVTEAILKIRSLIGIENFKNMFEVILTDNGSEFFDPMIIEFNLNTGEKISNVFYCDSNCSWQKDTLERNHEYIRYVLPKGTSFANLTQQDCDKLSSHINCIPRESLNKKTPYEAFCFLNDSKILDKLNITKISPDKVNLTKKLFKK